MRRYGLVDILTPTVEDLVRKTDLAIKHLYEVEEEKSSEPWFQVRTEVTALASESLGMSAVNLLETIPLSRLGPITRQLNQITAIWNDIHFHLKQTRVGPLIIKKTSAREIIRYLHQQKIVLAS
jgi:hypothetical protein